MSTPPTEQPAPLRTPRLRFLSQNAAVVGRKVTTRHGWVGDYDYAWLCTPSIPFFRKHRVSPPFYALESEIPLLVAITCGLQHALAMLAGLITPPIIFASSLNLDPKTSAYMISASLIGCGKDRSSASHSSSNTLRPGILSLVQMSRFRIWRNYYLGTGMLTVVGTSFATLSTASAVSVISRCFTYAEVSKDLQRSVLQRHMPLNNRAGRHGYTTSLS